MVAQQGSTPSTCVLLLVAAFAGACGGVGVDDRYELRRGTIDPYSFYWNDTTLFVPEEASLFEPVTVRVITVGGDAYGKGQPRLGRTG